MCCYIGLLERKVQIIITVKVMEKIECVYSLADDQEIVLNNGSKF